MKSRDHLLVRASRLSLAGGIKGEMQRNKRIVGGNDVGFLSVCYEYVLLSLVNKKAALVYIREKYSQTERDIESE